MTNKKQAGINVVTVFIVSNPPKTAAAVLIYDTCMCHEITHPLRKFNRSIRIADKLSCSRLAAPKRNNNK